jgi:hypothetical protein
MTEQEHSKEPHGEPRKDVREEPISQPSASWVGDLALGCVVLTISGVTLFALFLPVLQPGRPATRSERLVTERRMREIEQAEREVPALIDEGTRTGIDHDASFSRTAND